jgi:hypothetical protein
MKTLPPQTVASPRKANLKTLSVTAPPECSFRRNRATGRHSGSLVRKWGESATAHGVIAKSTSLLRFHNPLYKHHSSPRDGNSKMKSDFRFSLRILLLGSAVIHTLATG